MDSSERPLCDDQALYSDTCGEMDAAIRDLDQQIILNDMILCANGGMPYMMQQQDSTLQPNGPSQHMYDDSWQFYQDGFEPVQSSLTSSTLHDQQQVAAAAATAAGSQMMMAESNHYGRSRAQPPLRETRRSGGHPPNRSAAGEGGDSSTSSSNGSTSESSSSTGTGSSFGDWGATPVPRIPRNSRRALTTQQKKQQYHHIQQQQYQRRLDDSRAAAAAATAAVTSATHQAAAEAAAEAARTTTKQPERDVDLRGRDMPSAMKELAEMGDHLRNVAHQQRLMVDDTVHEWSGTETGVGKGSGTARV
ncbi:hypothetical protein PGQ11_012013 [Apiospora arundinis]|uniref:Uncharacterized protein n=1 Tax=Apiospora arundinis TaxID=335852 RepID=A0ABR2I1B0_9PEZI